MNDKHNGNGSSKGGTGPAPEPVVGSKPLPHAAMESGQDLWGKSPLLVWVADEGGHLSYLGGMDPLRPESEALKPADTELWPLVARLARSFRGTVGNGRPVQALEMLRGADGTVHQVLVIQFPFPVGGQRYLGSVGIDVTRQMLREDELAHLAMIDELTGLYNRRGFMLFADHELRAARRRKTDSAVFYIDIDGLKHINDTQGHDKGNAYILETVEILRREFRESDVIGRLGGDEFAVFAADVKGGRESLKRRLADRLLHSRPGDGPVKLSASVGVVACEPDEGITLGALLAAADQAMYLEKGARIRVASA